MLLFALALIACLTLPPWLAYREARSQAYGAETSLALGYARDVLHRADATSAQATRALRRLTRSRNTPCSPADQSLMRDIDLESSYIQALAYVVDGKIVCSSLGDTPIELGGKRTLTASGAVLYDSVRANGRKTSPLVAVGYGSYIVLVHRELPLDTWTAVPDVALAVMHLERRQVTIARGTIDPAWIARLGDTPITTFVDGKHLVALVVSPRYRAAALAAVPLTHLDAQVRHNAYRLLPVGVACGLLAAGALLLLARKRMTIATALRMALRRNEFFLLYQPLVDLRSGDCVGVEALLRWRRRTGELVGPDTFIPIAEQTGLITKLTGRVLELVEKDAGRYLAAHPDFHVAVNLSPADLQSPALLAGIDGLLARTGARASSLMLEITERGFMDLDSARGAIAALRSRGAGVAIDDFGTGYSSLAYLETLDLDVLKIDRAFIEAIGTGAPTSQVVGLIIAMARSMRLKMIAEGVESEAQAAFLRANGVELAQGWLFGKPMPFEEVIRSVRAARAPAPEAAAA